LKVGVSGNIFVQEQNLKRIQNSKICLKVCSSVAVCRSQNPEVDVRVYIYKFKYILIVYLILRVWVAGCSWDFRPPTRSRQICKIQHKNMGIVVFYLLKVTSCITLRFLFQLLKFTNPEMVNSTCGFCFGPQAFHETPVVVAPVQNKQIRMDTKRQKNDEVNLIMQSGQRR
jgi:hypothetical protein